MFDDYKKALENATQAITELREKAEEIKDTMECVIEACETIIEIV